MNDDFNPNENNMPPNNFPPPVHEPSIPPSNNKGMAIASMVLGIVSIVFSCCFYYISFPCAIIGLILGILSVKKIPDAKGMAIAGIVLSAISLAFAVIALILTIAMSGSIMDIIMTELY